MSLHVYRDFRGERELVGAFDSYQDEIRFSYDPAYVRRGEDRGEYGISESVPLDFGYYEPREYAPFFHGLLPEGAVLGNLAERYQVPRNDFLAFFEKLGCESIGALTFVAEGANLADFEPSYAPLDAASIQRMRDDAEREVTEMTDDLRLSLSGAQSKGARRLPPISSRLRERAGKSSPSMSSCAWISRDGADSSCRMSPSSPISPAPSR